MVVVVLPRQETRDAIAALIHSEGEREQNTWLIRNRARVNVEGEGLTRLSDGTHARVLIMLDDIAVEGRDYGGTYAATIGKAFDKALDALIDVLADRAVAASQAAGAHEVLDQLGYPSRETHRERQKKTSSHELSGHGAGWGPLS